MASTVTLTIDPEFAARCRKLKPREKSLLESSISQYGCLEPITVWANHEDTILDGHSRYEICQSLKLPYKTRALAFDDRSACLAWIGRNQEARRNESDLERTERIGKQYNELKKPAHRPEKGAHDAHLIPEKTAEAIGVSEELDPATVRRAAKFSDGIAAAVEVAGPEIRQAILTGEVKATQSQVASLAKMPAKERRAAVKSLKAGKAPKAKEPSPFDLKTASVALHKAIRKCLESWPKEHYPTFAHQLRNAIKDVEQGATEAA